MNPSQLSAARAYALDMHGAQMYGAHPYAHLLDAVARVLLPYGQEAQVIGYLHDVVEDTDATVDEVRLRFGDLVAVCVALLTDEPGANRKERKSKTYAKLAKVTGAEELALVVKVADRLSNVRACVADAHRELWSVYRGEHEVFRALHFGQAFALRSGLELDELMGDGKLVSSMSRRGNCHDNAVAESFFQLLKRERIRRQIYSTRDEARADVFNYIEMFYNPRRRHNTAGDLSPVEFERRHFQRLKSV